MTPEKLAAKFATQETIKGVGGLEASAGFTRVGKTVLGDAQNINCPERFLAIDVAVDIEKLARERDGWPHITRWMCAQMGGTFVPLPKAVPVARDLIGTMGLVAREAADVTQAICAAVADGHLERREIDAARRQIVEAQAALAVLDAQLAALGEERR